MNKTCRTCKAQYDHLGKRKDFQCPKCWQAYKKAWRVQRQAQGFKSDAYYWSPEKRKAWESRPEQKIKRAANQAIQQRVFNGTLKRKPCEKCQKPKAQAHHDDYSKPLEVRWLCAACHSAHHKKGR